MTKDQMLKIGLPIAVVVLAGAVAAFIALRSPPGPEFSAMAAPGTIAIFSSSPVAVRCTSSVVFSYIDSKGKRETGRHICQNYDIPVGDNHEVCRATTRDLIEPKIEGDVTAECGG